MVFHVLVYYWSCLQRFLVPSVIEIQFSGCYEEVEIASWLQTEVGKLDGSQQEIGVHDR